MSDQPPLKDRLVHQLRRPPVQLLLFFVVWSAWFLLRSSDDAAGKLVVYCAHDSVFSEKILRDFGYGVP